MPLASPTPPRLALSSVSHSPSRALTGGCCRNPPPPSPAPRPSFHPSPSFRPPFRPHTPPSLPPSRPHLGHRPSASPSAARLKRSTAFAPQTPPPANLPIYITLAAPRKHPASTPASTPQAPRAPPAVVSLRSSPSASARPPLCPLSSHVSPSPPATELLRSPLSGASSSRPLNSHPRLDPSITLCAACFFFGTTTNTTCACNIARPPGFGEPARSGFLQPLPSSGGIHGLRWSAGG